MERYQTIRAFSAGGVVFRLISDDSKEKKGNGNQWRNAQYNNMSVEVALVGRSHSGMWALPKGTPEAGETLEQVAVREVQEETGLKVRLIAYIGNISYSFIHDKIRFQKQVRHFLFEAIGGDTSLHDAEYDRVEWFSIPEALRRLTYQNEANILSQAEDILNRWLQTRQKEG
jgi:8-oxo-dGTP pyrophosphatase MutT (NUDIX family)